MTTDLERAPDATIDPGQIIRIDARFPKSPANVLFSFLPPGADKGVHDPGVAKDGTKITKDGDLHTFRIDTAGMHGGKGWWYFFSEDEDLTKRRAKVGTFIVREVPRALIEREPVVGAEPKSKTSGMLVYGVDPTPLFGFVAKLFR